jgi:hypothetical protein
MRDRAEPSKQTAEPAGTRRRSEGVTLVFAVVLAVGLGVAVGLWINARLTQTQSAGAPRPARVPPAALVAATPEPAAQTSPCDGCETSSLVEATPARSPADKSDKAEPEADSGTPTGVARATPTDVRAEPPRPAEVANGGAEADGAAASEAVAAASPDPSRPMAWEVAPRPKAGARDGARANVGRGAAQSGQRAAGGEAQAPPEPCALYVSASSLSVRAGGASPLILGGPGVGVRINVSTPDWSALAVIYEGPAAGRRGWLRYSVRSVGSRPGLYTVHVSSPCGSQTILVTVK